MDRGVVQELVALARAACSGRSPADVERGSASELGVFVTLKSFPGGELRGCIGFPFPFGGTRRMVLEAALGAADDPRFPPVKPDEMASTCVELSLLGAMERVARPPEGIVVGVHGLYLKGAEAAGLLLPQVAVELGLDGRSFCEAVARKAGLADAAGAELFKFPAEVWAERAPGGEVERVL